MKTIIYKLLSISLISYRICIVFIFGFNVKKNLIGYIVLKKFSLIGYIYLLIVNILYT